MQNLPISLLASGMVLAKPVTNEKGAVLLAQGAELTDGMIQRLVRMEVARVTVEGNPVPMPGDAGRSVEERIKQIDDAFARVEEDSGMMTIKSFFVKFAKRPPWMAEDEGDSESGEPPEAGK